MYWHLVNGEGLGRACPPAFLAKLGGLSAETSGFPFSL